MTGGSMTFCRSLFMQLALKDTGIDYLFCRSLFKQLDLKNDGRIDAEELAAGLQNMGYSNLSKVTARVGLEVYINGFD